MSDSDKIENRIVFDVGAGGGAALARATASLAKDMCDYGGDGPADRKLTRL